MIYPPGYIELDRRFRQLDNTVSPEESAASSYLSSSGASPALGWNDLLHHRLVVVLGEPGSGKSWEFRHRFAQLADEGSYSFLIELERLVHAGLADVLPPEHKALFEQWKASSRNAHFFLDSVDEAKIRRQADFYFALEKLRHALGPHNIERAYLAISSRISEWRPETDLKELQARFGSLRPQKTRNQTAQTTEPQQSTEKVLVVQLEPLDRDRVHAFIRGKQIINPDGFVAALDKHSAWEFARRPLDVLDLAQFWTANGRLGTLTEIIENDISLKLKEAMQRLGASVLSEAQAREGAETLAAATVFCKQQQFKVPDESFVALSALDATRCLPATWRMEEVNALLNRPLFDSATYGQIRFHHRRIGEYLAARWLSSRMEQGCPIQALEQILFTTTAGQRVLRESLAPVAAWLCSGEDRWNYDVRSWVREAAPEIHFHYGDPAALPLEYRQQILAAWIHRNRDRTRVWVYSSPDALGRLADPGLAGYISELLLDKALPSDVREELTQLVRFGDLQECQPALLAIISCPRESPSLQQYAVTAIRDTATNEVRRALWEIVGALPVMSDRLRVLCCETLYPNAIGALELAQLLSKRATDRDHGIDPAWGIERHLDQTLRREQSSDLLRHLNELVQRPPRIRFGERDTRISQQFEWLLDVIPTVVGRLLSGPFLSDSECDVAAEALSLLGESHYIHNRTSETVATLDQLTLTHPSVRRAHFWLSVRRWRETRPSSFPHIHFFFGYDSVLHAAESDLAWLTSDIESFRQQEDKTVALQVALQLPNWAQQCARDRTRLRRAVSADPELSATLRTFLLERRWGWIRRLKYRLTNGDLWRDRSFRGRIACERRWDHIRTQAWLYRHLGHLRSGTALAALASLCSEAEESGHRWAPTNWSQLNAKRGYLITQATISGCKVFWRTYVPPLPHEKPEPNQIPYAVVVGLAGIQAAISAHELSLDKITAEESRLATRYAVNEMNGFPSWLSLVAEVRPAAVGEVLRDCIDGEWDYPAAREQVHDVLADLAWEGGPLARLVLPAVLEKLETRLPVNERILGYALTLCLKVASLPNDTLTRVALDQCQRLPVDDRAFALWCGVALQLDAVEAIGILERRLPESNSGDDVVLRICGVLGSRDRLPMIARPTFLLPSSLYRLVPLVYRHIRPDDDIDRIGKGAYSPTERDEAQEFRNGLFMQLAQSDDRDATDVLRAFVHNPSLASHRDWLLHLLDQRLKKEGDRLQWLEQDVRTFATDFETDPKAEGDLFIIIWNRLTDIKHDVERSDNSLREEVQIRSDESVLRRFVARKLSERSRMRYTIPQEGEIDLEERPDLRAEHPKTSPVSLEVKWADNWTIPDLIAGLENQLVGKYLRSHKSRYGVYVVGVDGREKKAWRGNGGRHVAFEEVMGILQDHALQLTMGREELEEVRVIGIDFRRPR